MGDLSEHFSRYEIACKCGCGFDSMDTETLALAEECRAFVGQSITPSSGCRCAKHNAKIGGSSRSQHVFARAMDLPVADPQALYDYLDAKYQDKYGIGLYSTFVHIDTRSGDKARWRGK